LTDYGDHTWCFSCGKYTNKINVNEENQNYFDNSILTSEKASIYYKYTTSDTDSMHYKDTTSNSDSIYYYNNNNRNTMSKVQVSYRNISKETMAFYDCYCLLDTNSNPIEVVFPYNESAAKHRLINQK